MPEYCRLCEEEKEAIHECEDCGDDICSFHSRNLEGKKYCSTCYDDALERDED